MKEDFTYRVMRAVKLLREHDLADVAKFLSAAELRDRTAKKTKRKRGVKVRLGGGKWKVTLDAERVAELQVEDGE
jgi:hypothetical protein